MPVEHPGLRLPPGTQVVTRVAVRRAPDAAPYAAGTVGVIVALPDAPPAYRVRFADGGEAVLRRHELIIRKHHQRPGLGADAGPAADALRPYIIYSCVVGSRAYGLDGPESDTDRRGIYLPPARLHWALAGVPDQIEDVAAQEC